MGAGADSRTAASAPVPWVQAATGAVMVLVHVQPGARRTAVVGTHGERLKIALQAPAADNRANQALVELLALRLALPRSALTIASGATARAKRLRVETTLSAAQVAARLLAEAP